MHGQDQFFFYRSTTRKIDLFLSISCQVQIYSRLTYCCFLFVDTLLDILPIFYIHCRFVGFRFSIRRQLITNYYHFGLVCAWMHVIVVSTIHFFSTCFQFFLWKKSYQTNNLNANSILNYVFFISLSFQSRPTNSKSLKNALLASVAFSCHISSVR